MPRRNEVLSRAADDCMKELYSLVQPSVKWNDFIRQCEVYSKKYKIWERIRQLSNKENLTEEELKEYSMYPVYQWKDKSITECIGPRPYEFYYLPKDIFKNIVDSYIHAYKMDDQQNLLDIIEILKNYCKEPVVDKYIDDWTDETGFHHPGYRSYDHPNNLEKELIEICDQHSHEPVNMAKEIQDKFFEFLDMAGKFYNWNRDLNSFNMTVYLGPSPNSNKQAVINNWKKYKNQDIEIDEEQIKKDYYGEELD